MKTILIVGIAVIITIVLMQNLDQVNFSFFWATFKVSKLIIMVGVAFFAFILGVLVARPRKVKRLDDQKTLSSEDQNYIK